MATIRGATARGLRVTPSLDIGQAATLGLGGLLAWAAIRAHWPVPLRGLGAAGSGAAALLAAVGRWPPGPLGERLPVWAARLVRHALAARDMAAGGYARRWGARAVGAGWIAAPWGRLRVWVCDGADFASRASGSREAAETAFREFLHALDGPLQVVVSTRFIEAEDRPRTWDPERSPPEIRDAAAAFAEHWAALVASRRVSLRTYLTVLRVDAAAGADAAGPAPDVEGAFLAFAGRIGLQPARPSGRAMAVSLCGASAGPGHDGGAPPSWRVNAVERA